MWQIGERKDGRKGHERPEGLSSIVLCFLAFAGPVQRGSERNREWKVWAFLGLHCQDKCSESEPRAKRGPPQTQCEETTKVKGNSHAHFFLIFQDECANFRAYLRNDELLCTRENDPVRGADGKLYKNKCYMCRTVL